MSYSYAIRREAYLSWRPIFARNNNAQLRKRAKIRDLVDNYVLHPHLFRHPDLITILQSLLEEHVFSAESMARNKFPDIFESPEANSTRLPGRPESGEPMDELKWSLREQVAILTSFYHISNNIRLYSSSLYSDFTIFCHERRYLVHKAIICPRSDFFAAACRAGLKEEREGIINLDDDDPVAVASMVCYFYHLDYDPKRVDVPLVGDQQGPPERTSTELITHAQIYTLAEKYGIKALKSLALEKFEAATRYVHSKEWKEDFLAATEEAFTSTAETDRGLREVVLKTFHKHHELINEDNTQTLLKKLNSLTFDLLMYKNSRDTTSFGWSR